MVTSVDKKIQIAHLMRRAGFGSNYDQIQEEISLNKLPTKKSMLKQISDIIRI